MLDAGGLQLSCRLAAYLHETFFRPVVLEGLAGALNDRSNDSDCNTEGINKDSNSYVITLNNTNDNDNSNHDSNHGSNSKDENNNSNSNSNTTNSNSSSTNSNNGNGELVKAGREGEAAAEHELEVSVD